jgi:predicted RNase H-like HicB family nuclease
MPGRIERYKLIIWWSDIDGHFIGEMPELAGCVADDSTREEVLSNIRVSAQEWIETAEELGRAIPEPEVVFWPPDDPVLEKLQSPGH